MTDLVWIVSSCVMIIAVAAIRAIFGKKMSAGFRYALWALVAVRLLIPGTFFKSPVSIKTAVMKTEVAENMESVKDFSSVELSGENEAIARPRYNRPTVNPANNAAANTETKPENTSSQIPAAEEKPAETVEKVTVIKNVTPERVKTYQKTIKARDILNVVWITGMALMAAYMLYVNIRLYLKLRERRVRLETDAPCRVYSVDGIESSCLFFNTVYVSKESAEDPEKLKCVLAHELSHRRHGDGFINLMRSAALVLHWYNPLVWYAAFASRQDSELFADAGAVKTLGEAKRQNYGMTLIELSTKPSVRASIACTATTMANNKRSVKERVKNVAARRRTTALIAAIVLAVALLATGCAFLGSAAAGNKLVIAEEDAVKTTPAPTETPETTVPTQDPAPEPTDDWFYEEAWKTVSEIVKLYNVDTLWVNPDYLKTIDRLRDDPYKEGAEDRTDVFFGSLDNGPNVTVRFVRDSAAESGWRADQWSYRPAFDQHYDYDRIHAERRVFGTSFRYIVTPEMLAAAGYADKGSEQNVENAARLVLDRAAKMFTGLDENSPLYCRDAQPIGIGLEMTYEDNGQQRYKYKGSIAVLPKDPLSFKYGFVEALSEWLYTGEAHSECRYYMWLFAELDAARQPDGKYEVYFELPENYTDYPEEPDPEDLTDEWFIEEAWKVINRISEVHNLQFDKAMATVSRSGSKNVRVDFPLVSIPGQVYQVLFEKNENGNFVVWAVAPEETDDEAGAAYTEWRINEAKTYEKLAELSDTQLTVTESDVRAYGCTAAIGTDEYLDAVANCYMQKLVALYTEEFGADSPFRCYEVRGTHCGKAGAPYTGTVYTIVIDFRTKDPLALMYVFDFIPWFIVNTEYSMDLYGWLSAWTMVDINVAADGSWTGSGMLNGAA